MYFGAFRRLLLNTTKANLADVLARPGAAPNGDSGYIYQALKAYLITTSNPEKSTSDFLPPVLTTHWLHGRAADERVDLARCGWQPEPAWLREHGFTVWEEGGATAGQQPRLF